VIGPWVLKHSEPVADCRIFQVRKDTVVSPRTGQSHDMFVLENPPWVNIIPLTSDNQVVMIRQWRHGTRSVHLETPGGLLEPGETPIECARRELLEETGYAATNLISLGTTHPNPALQSNMQHYLLATGCHSVGVAQLDNAEDIAVQIFPLLSIPDMIRAGQITHGIVIGGFYWLNLHFECHRTPIAP